MCSSSNDFTLVKLLYIVTEGFLLTSYTFGVDLPGGILMPSLVLGATTGRFVGILSQILQSKFNWESLATCTEQSCVVSPSSYAVIGAASFMTGITKLTMCVVVIMFEMTGAVTYVLPIMCGVMTSKFVNDWLCPNNIYDTWLQNNFNQKDDDYDLQQSQNLVNHGKGTGLISFSNSTSTIKTKLPDISVKSLMVPLNQVKCLCLIPENGDYTLSNLTSFINDDCHEGYPMIINYSNPVYLGYVPKSHLLSKLSNLDDSTTPISFQVENLPTSALSIQLHYERKLNDFIHLDIIPTRSPFKFNEDTPGLLIIEAFEKLNLNKLVIFKDDGIMCGFIDRFILTNLVNDKFEGLVNEFNDFEAINEYDLETGLSNEMLSTGDLRINRKSIELIT
ncbi:H(+)/Cl(-) exchange transporter 5 [Candida tropicalis]